MQTRKDLIEFIEKVITDPRMAYELGDEVIELVAQAIINRQEFYKIMKQKNESTTQEICRSSI